MRDNFGNSQPIYGISTVRLAEMPRKWEHMQMENRRASKRGRRGATAERGTGGWTGGPVRSIRVGNKDNCKRRHGWDETSHPLSKKKKKENDKHWPGGRSGETGTLTDAGGNVKWYSRYWKQMSLKKLNTELTYNPAIPLVGILPKGQSMDSNRYLYTEVHSSIS